MAAVAVAFPQQAGASETLVALLDDCWYCRSVFSPADDQLASAATETAAPARKRSQKKLVVSPLTVEFDANSIWSTGGKLQKWCHSIDEKEIKAIFGRLDENADGLISGEELRRFMSCWGIEMTEADAKCMIKSVDQNCNGVIDFEEFSSLYRANVLEQDAVTEEEDEEILEGAFRVFDKNQDGFISAQELQAVLLGLGLEDGKSLMQCQKMISTVDRDGNGQCDIEEFRTMMSPQPSIQKLRR